MDVLRKAKSALVAIETALERARPLVTCHGTDATTTVIPGANALLTLDEDGARRAAAAIDERRAAGVSPRPLDGLPVLVKDNLMTAGLRSTCASAMLADFVPPYDATSVARLRAAGAVILGKTNLDEFGMGSTNEHSAFGAVRHPIDPARVPGGSSGGAAAAVALGAGWAAIASDTGGSIRQPAAYCSLVGLKPTYGRVSRFGLAALASSLDCVGWIVHSAQDSALLFNALAGYDPHDATSSREPVESAVAVLARGAGGLRIGLTEDAAALAADCPVAARALARASAVWEALGAHVIPVAMPHADAAVATYYILNACEASANMARYDGLRYGAGGDAVDAARGTGLGMEVKRRVLMGAFALSAGYYDAYYDKAMRVRALVAEDYVHAFDGVDLLCSPVAAGVAPRLGGYAADPLAMYLSDRFTVPASLAGLPALAFPAGEVEGLPVGLQLTGPRWSEPLLHRAAHAFAAAHDALPSEISGGRP